MADINVLMVTDGTRFNFGPLQSDTDPADPNYFGLTILLGALTDPNNVPSISVYTAHRRRSQITTIYPHTAEAINYPEDFLFTGTAANPVNLFDYDAIWLIGDEGINGGTAGPTDVPLTAGELEAIANFMSVHQGGVFAVGDHDGLGSYMCRHMMRVRTMRRWVYGGDEQPDATNQTFTTNWSAAGSAMNLPDRNDTLRPDQSGNGLYYFYDQSDQTAQPVLAGGGTPPMGSGPLANATLIHSIMRGAGGVVIPNFPDHMHEGEATDFQTIMGDPPATPFNPNTGASATKYSVPTKYVVNSSQANGFTPTAFDEFPSPNGFQPGPEVVAWGSDLGHSSLDPTVGMTNPKNRGIVCVYDGRQVGVGRIITGSTFHHYLDKNLWGDPGTAGTNAPPTGTDTGFRNSPAILNPIQQYYRNAVAWLARPNPNFYFVTNKNVFGFDEVQSAAAQHSTFPSAFYVVFDGLPSGTVSSNPTITLSGPFSSGLGYRQDTAVTVGNRVLVPFDILSIPAGFFPSPNGSPNILILEASATAGGASYAAETEFELVGGEDPYFTNVDPTVHNVFYLSQDLRVFTTTSGSAPFATFPAGAPYTYIQNLLRALNSNPSFNVSGASDPFMTLAPSDSLEEDTSVNPGTPASPNYYFAVARVRLAQGGSMQPSVRVFFRLFSTQSNDTDYAPETTYLSTYDANNLPATPQPGIDGSTFPMFATPGGGGDFVNGVNQNPLTIPSGSTAESWTYFGCYLDFSTVSPPLPGTHHCLVAQIAYDGAPIINSTGVTLGPENSNLLAQRNLQITPAG
jgi:hypothetical protein